jgi:hypothetical protein
MSLAATLALRVARRVGEGIAEIKRSAMNAPGVASPKVDASLSGAGDVVDVEIAGTSSGARTGVAARRDARRARSTADRSNMPELVRAAIKRAGRQ